MPDLKGVSREIHQTPELIMQEYIAPSRVEEN